MNKDTIENLKSLMNPFLTVWFSMLFAVVIFIGLIKYNVDVKDLIAVVGGVLSTIIGYHFGRASKE